MRAENLTLTASSAKIRLKQPAVWHYFVFIRATGNCTPDFQNRALAQTMTLPALMAYLASKPRTGLAKKLNSRYLPNNINVLNFASDVGIQTCGFPV